MRKGKRQKSVRLLTISCQTNGKLIDLTLEVLLRPKKEQEKAFHRCERKGVILMSKKKQEMKVKTPVTHKAFSRGYGEGSNEAFAKACREAGVKATSRQAAKFRRQKGAAYLIAIKGVEGIHIPPSARA